jgi:hypothetical protein
VGAVAERRIRRLATTAEGDSGAAAQTKRVSSLIDNFEIAFDTYGTVVEDCDASAGHKCLRLDVVLGGDEYDSGCGVQCKLQVRRLTVDS